MTNFYDYLHTRLKKSHWNYVFNLLMGLKTFDDQRENMSIKNFTALLACIYAAKKNGEFLYDDWAVFISKPSYTAIHILYKKEYIGKGLREGNIFKYHVTEKGVNAILKTIKSIEDKLFYYGGEVGELILRHEIKGEPLNNRLVQERIALLQIMDKDIEAAKEKNIKQIEGLKEKRHKQAILRAKNNIIHNKKRTPYEIQRDKKLLNEL